MPPSLEHGGDDDRETEANETTTLLSSPTTTEAHIKTKLKAASHRSWPWKYVVALCMALAIVSDIGEYLYAAPRVRLFESVVCTRYYLQNDPSFVDQNGSVAEKFCKIDPVQDEVALVLGWQLFFDSIPAILLPIPYGYIADKKGRKWILVSALIGYTLSWASTLFLIGVAHSPLQWVWLSSIFFLIGGGPTVETTMITTIVADVVPPELRTVVFFYRFCTDLVAEFLVPPVASILMDQNIWIPLVAAVVFQALSALMTLPLPETLPKVIVEPVSGTPNSPPVISSAPDTDDQLVLGGKSLSSIRETFGFVTRNPTVAALISTFLVSKVGRQANNILFQYVSKRYEWSLSQAGLLLSVRAGVNIFLFAVILPAIAKYTLSRTNAVSRDLWIGKASIVLTIIGAFIMFSSSTAIFMIIGLVVYTLGTGFPPIIRSLVTLLVESHHTSKTSDIGRLYAIISAMEGIGSLVAGPAMAGAFRLGISLGTAWLGLPFAFAAILFALVSVIVFSIRV